jgi:hypothetical protein
MRLAVLLLPVAGCTVHSPLVGEEVSMRQYFAERSVAVCDQMARCNQLGVYGTHATCVKKVNETVCAKGACDEPGNARRLRDACVPAERDRPCGTAGRLAECDPYTNPVE